MRETLTYYLPETRVRFTATVARTTDKVLGGEPTVDVDDAQFTFEPWRDEQAKHTVKLDAGVLRDIDVSLGLSEDQRLTSFDGTSTGQLGAVIKAGVSLAATGAGLVLAGPAGAGGFAAAVAASTRQLLPQEEGPPTDKSPADRAWDAYSAKHPDAAQRLTEYKKLRASVAKEVLGARQELVREAGNHAARREAERKVAALRRLLAETDADVARLTALFEAWWRSEQEQEERTVTALWEMRHLPRIAGGELDWTSGATDVEPTAKSVWDEYGLALARDESRTDPDGAAEIVHGTPSHDGVWVRHPRLVVLHVVHKRTDGTPRIERTERRLVMDDKCTREFLPFDTSAFRKRALTLEFSPLGALIGIKESRSGAADVASAVAGLPTAAVEGLETANKLLTVVDTLRAHDDTEAIARLKRQIERKTQELNQKSLDANEADFVELQRLKQTVEIVNARKALSGVGASVLSGLIATDSANAPAWYAAPATQPTPTATPSVEILITLPDGSQAEEQ